jgi:hypothetical protein
VRTTAESLKPAEFVREKAKYDEHVKSVIRKKYKCEI